MIDLKDLLAIHLLAESGSCRLMCVADDALGKEGILDEAAALKGSLRNIIEEQAIVAVLYDLERATCSHCNDRSAIEHSLDGDTPLGLVAAAHQQGCSLGDEGTDIGLKVLEGDGIGDTIALGLVGEMLLIGGIDATHIDETIAVVAQTELLEDVECELCPLFGDDLATEDETGLLGRVTGKGEAAYGIVDHMVARCVRKGDEVVVNSLGNRNGSIGLIDQLSQMLPSIERCEAKIEVKEFAQMPDMRDVALLVLLDIMGELAAEDGGAGIGMNKLDAGIAYDRREGAAGLLISPSIIELADRTLEPSHAVGRQIELEGNDSYRISQTAKMLGRRTLGRQHDEGLHFVAQCMQVIGQRECRACHLVGLVGDIEYADHYSFLYINLLLTRPDSNRSCRTTTLRSGESHRGAP